jgi:branched-subunit amino acid aminotransferase/4-amino-4-deoxychorismate lyase
MNYVFARGEYVSENQLVLTRDNRAFRFGDGFFESIRVFNGKAVFFENHFARIRDCLPIFRIIPPENFSQQLLQSQVNGLIERNGIREGGRVRITFFRKSQGFYSPRNNDLGYIIEAEATPENNFLLNPAGKTVDIYTELRKDINRLSIYKTLNAQLYVMSSLWAREKGYDEALVQNNKGAVIESTSSNIFIVSNGVLYTPSLDDGCVAGTMRMNVINLAIDNKIKVYECTLNPQNLLTADELFLTNAIRGVEWVVSYRTKRYYNEMSKRMLTLLNNTAHAATK